MESTPKVPRGQNLTANRAAIYCRVSTAAQEREGASLETQLLGCKEVCDGKGFAVVVEYTDVESGLNFDRPDYQMVLGAASDREFVPDLPSWPQLGGLTNNDQFPDPPKNRRPNPLHPCYLLNRKERPIQFPVGHYVSRSHRSDARQGFQQCGGSLIQIDQSPRGLTIVLRSRQSRDNV